MNDVKTVIEGLEEIRDNLIPALAKMYGSGFSSVFACEKTKEKFENAINMLNEQEKLAAIMSGGSEGWHFSGKPEIPKGGIGVTVIVCADDQVYPLKYRKVTIRGKEQCRYEWMFGNIYGRDDTIKAWRYLPQPPKEGEA